MEIGEPTLLARLPRGGLIENGQIQLAQVYGISENGKKKRHEICAAVDGNSVNVFEISNGRNVSSFTVPPDASFVCQPCSSRSKLAGGVVQRKTFCITKRRSKVSLQCFIEHQDGELSKVQNFSSVLEDNDNKVILLQPSSDDKHVMVLREDGNTSIFSNDASTLSLQTQLVSTSGPCQIIAGKWLSLQEAKTSILKSRADITTSLSPDSGVLAAVYKHNSSQDLHLGIWMLSATSAGLTTKNFVPTVDHSLPGSISNIAKGKIQADFLQNAARLNLETINVMLRFDLTTIVPRVISEQSHPNAGQVSYLEVSDNLTLTASKSGLQLLNTRFRSVLATTAVETSFRKRKRNGPNVMGPLTLVSYFPQLRRAIAFQQNQILAIDVQNFTNSLQSFKQSSLLIENIGKGSKTSVAHKAVTASTVGNVQRQVDPSDDWASTMEQLDNLGLGGQTEEFQSLFIKSVAKGLDAMPQRASVVPDFMLDYLLSKLFSLDVTASGKTSPNLQPLKIALLCPQLIHWCTRQGLIERHRLERVLSSHVSLDSSVRLKPGAAAIGLIKADPSLQLVHYYLQHTPYLNSQELGVIVQNLVRNALLYSVNPDPTAIPDVMLEESKRGVSDALAVIQAHTPQKDQSLVEPIINCLATALNRLIGLGSANTLAAIQASMENSDILVLIQFLRQQLFRGGYTRYMQFETIPTPPPSRNGSCEVDLLDDIYSPKLLPLENLISILSCCVDALGALGIIGSDDEPFMKTLVPDLLTEISSAGDALEEATYLEGLVRETLRYTESVQKQPDHVQSRLGAKPAIESNATGSIVTLYSDTGSESSSKIIQSALPISLRVDDEINRIKVIKGGGPNKQRSLREMGMLQDRLRPVYSLERLVL